MSLVEEGRPEAGQAGTDNTLQLGMAQSADILAKEARNTLRGGQGKNLWFLPLRCEVAAWHTCTTATDGQTDTTGGPLYVRGVHNNSPVVTEQTTTHTPTTGVVFVFSRRPPEGKRKKEQRGYVNTPATNTQAWRNDCHPRFTTHRTHKTLLGETPQRVNTPCDKTKISKRHTGPVVSPP